MMRFFALIGMLLFVGTGGVLAQETTTQKFPPDRVLVKIGDETITQGYFDMAFDEIPATAKPQWDNPKAKRKLLREMIEVKLLAKEARRLDLDKDPAVSIMIQSGIERTLALQYQAYVLEQTQVTDEEAKAYWEQNKDRFNVPEQVHVRHIVVRTEKEMKEVQDELKTGKDFAEVAKEKSIGPAQPNGGDLGWISRGYILQPLEDAAFRLSVGEVSDPIQTQFGYHIIKVYDRKPTVERPYAEVETQVLGTVQRERAYRKIEEAKLRLGTENKVEVVNDPAVYSPTKAELRQSAQPEESSKN